MMTRRSFIARVMAAVAGGMVLDTDKLLWVPGAKTIFVPPDPGPFLLPRLQLGDVFTIAGVDGQFTVTDDLARSDKFLAHVRRDPAARLHGNVMGQLSSRPLGRSRLNV